RLLKRVRDFAQVRADGKITLEIAKEALSLLEIDLLGLDSTDKKIIEVMIHNFGGGPVGLDTLAASTGEERSTIEDVYEPYLLQIVFNNRTPTCRVVLEKAYEHFNIPFQK